jgi:hypothetical protein
MKFYEENEGLDQLLESDWHALDVLLRILEV